MVGLKLCYDSPPIFVPKNLLVLYLCLHFSSSLSLQKVHIHEKLNGTLMLIESISILEVTYAL